MVEFALVAVLLVLIVTAIINFGLILDFKQDVTRSAAEGARVAAVALPPAGSLAIATGDPRYQAAVSGTDTAVESFGEECGAGGLTCNVTVHDCNAAPVANTTAYLNNGANDCVTVELIFDYDANPIIVEPPVISAFLPNTIEAKSVARLNQ